MPTPLTQYVFRVMQQTNMTVQLIVDISYVLPVYIRQISGCHNSELSRAVPVIIWKGIAKEAALYHLGDVIIVSQTRNDFVPVGTWGGKTSEQIRDAHAIAVRYEGLYGVGRQTDPIPLLGNHVSVLPDLGGYI